MAAAFSLFGLSRWVPHLHQNMLLRFALLNAAGGLLAYNYLALGFPGSELLIQVFRGFSGLIVGLSGALVGLALGWTWSALRR
jgi:hypothetical protein